ncbi:MAG TPA: phospholipase D-like domain-containing protein [Nocardioidaceae bacterium]|nr:phospholipase D-like domain-containing protein [Nocardioidaceae bacterium]
MRRPLTSLVAAVAVAVATVVTPLAGVAAQGATVAHGSPSADGTTTPPFELVANNDRARIRAGEKATTDVLANDSCTVKQQPCPSNRVRISIDRTTVPKNVEAHIHQVDGTITVTVPDHRRAGRFSIWYILRNRFGQEARAALRVRVVYPGYSPRHATPHGGPTFNDPEGDLAHRRNILHQVIVNIDSVRGYKVDSRRQCPRNIEYAPNEIKISLYSIADMNFVNALIRAVRRCVSVQLLMNDHLDATTSPSWGKLLRVVGNDRTKYSWTYRCKSSCRGRHGVLHSKFYLFSKVGKRRDVVMVGSSNMTTNASHVQWNDLLTRTGHPKLYDEFRSVFEEMAPDKYVPDGFRHYTAGPYDIDFWPQIGATAKDDALLGYFKSIRCKGATGGAGRDGHTVVYINIHAWHSSPRGQYLADKVRSLWAHGCWIHILYSFMGHHIFHTLEDHTNRRMVVLRTLFPQKDTDVARIYSHMKNIAVSGHTVDDTSTWVVWTGSNNFTNMGVHSDEVMMRVPFRDVYRKYVRHWHYIAHTMSSPTWAIYSEPSGGGRAPDDTDRVAARMGRSPTTRGTSAPTVRRLSPLQIRTPGQDMD